jgi:hypothetical protein
MQEVIPNMQPDVVLIMAGANDLSLALSGTTTNAYERTGLPFKVYTSSRLVQYLYGWYRVWRGAVTSESAHRSYTPTSITQPELVIDSVLWQPNLDNYRYRLWDLIVTAAVLDVHLVLVTQPTLFTAHPRWRTVAPGFNWTKEASHISAATYADLLEGYNQDMLSLCTQAGVTCVDLSSMNGNADYFYDPLHFTEAGAQRVAELISAEMLAP